MISKITFTIVSIPHYRQKINHSKSDFTYIFADNGSYELHIKISFRDTLCLEQFKKEACAVLHVFYSYLLRCCVDVAHTRADVDNGYVVQCDVGSVAAAERL